MPSSEIREKIKNQCLMQDKIDKMYLGIIQIYILKVVIYLANQHTRDECSLKNVSIITHAIILFTS